MSFNRTQFVGLIEGEIADLGDADLGSERIVWDEHA
jgi:hypothetical protein